MSKTCESCGQELPKSGFRPGNIVEYRNELIDSRWLGVVVTPYVADLLGRSSPTCAQGVIRCIRLDTGDSYTCEPDQLTVVHGYIHLDRTPPDDIWEV